MLERLFIKNIGLIDEAEIDFSKGLNILTGETGAGKSMIINSIDFLRGRKIDKDFIRKDCTEAIVEASYTVDVDKARKTIKEMGIDIDEDNYLVILRKYANGKITNRVNGNSVTVGMLKTISENLVELNGQNESHRLLDTSKHLEIVDKFCGKQINDLKEELSGYLKEYEELQVELRDLLGEEGIDRKISILKYELEEITQAELQPDEEEILRDRYKILCESKDLYGKISQVMGIVYEDELSVRNLFSQANQLFSYIADKDDKQKKILEGMETILIDIDELKQGLKQTYDYYDYILENSSSQIHEVEERLEFIYELKLKYKKDVNGIIGYKTQLEDELQKLDSSAERIKFLNEGIDCFKCKIKNVCEKISQLRTQTSEDICSQLEKNFTDLSMPNAKAKIIVNRKTCFDKTGFDSIEFLISTNLGEPFKPVNKILSGGETSRIMLALETVFASNNNVSTLIFDEIDAGVSGKVAQNIAEKLNLLSLNHQVICITHLPQIAVMADTHFLIKKTCNHESTYTKIYELDDEQSLQEIAKIVSGSQITKNTLQVVSEMKSSAKQIKSLLAKS